MMEVSNPLMAMMWVVPVAEKSAIRSAGIPVSTPNRMPVKREACGSGSSRAMMA